MVLLCPSLLCPATAERKFLRMTSCSAQGYAFNFSPTRSGLILCDAYFYKKVSAFTASRLRIYTSSHWHSSLGGCCTPGLISEDNKWPRTRTRTIRFPSICWCPSSMKADHCHRVLCLTCPMGGLIEPPFRHCSWGCHQLVVGRGRYNQVLWETPCCVLRAEGKAPFLRLHCAFRTAYGRGYSHSSQGQLVSTCGHCKPVIISDCVHTGS